MVLVSSGCSTEEATPARADQQSAMALSVLDPGGALLLPAAAVRTAPLPAGDRGAFSRDEERFLGDLAGGRSYSIGTASRGYLVGGRALPTGVGSGPLAARPISVRRKAVHGTDELVGALERAAASVASRWPGSVLYAGDLSGERGGDLPGHASHNSGRDADLAFYLRDIGGRIADSSGFARVGADGLTAGGATFDAPRNWELVAALLRDPNVQLQWIFLARHLKDRLLAHARETEASAELITRAERVVRQPRDSSPHAGHFHVRVYCALEERVEGCLDYGATHEWIDTYDAALAERVGHVLPFLRRGSRDELTYAITRLVRLRVRAAADHVAPLIEHADPHVAALAEDAVGFLRGERTPPRWAHLREEDPGE